MWNGRFSKICAAVINAKQIFIRQKLRSDSKVTFRFGLEIRVDPEEILWSMSEIHRVCAIYV